MLINKIKNHWCHLAVACGLGLFSLIAQAETIVDIAGRTVEVPKEPVKRIILGEGRLMSALALLEGDKPLDRIAGWQGDFKKIDPQNYELYKEKFPEIDKITLIGATTEQSVSAEKVLTLDPDLAILGVSGHGPSMDSPLVKQLESAGIPIVFIDFRTAPLTNSIPSIRILGKMLHREAEAEKYIAFYQKELKRVTDITNVIAHEDKPKVFIELKAGTWKDCCHTAGNGNMGDFIDLAGGNNIAKSLLPAALGQINVEKILAEEPELYIATGNRTPGAKNAGVQFGALTTPEQALISGLNVLTFPGIKDLKAVKEGNNYAVWHGFYNSPYNILAIQAFAKWFYPEKFVDLDPQETMERMYKEFLVVEPKGTYWLKLGK